MSVEGLKALLAKESIVGTQSVDRLVQAPEAVEEAYLRHVRSYVPLGRIADAEGQTQSVDDFEKRLIRLVKEAKAPTGYVTAEYGYGKTSTCLYLWLRCRDAGIIAVPPFEFTELPELLTATHAWVRFELQKVRPDLVPQTDRILSKYERRSLEDLARQRGSSLEELQSLYDEGLLVLRLAPAMYVQFFTEMANLVLQAGFQGLVIVPDEVQQYLDPQIKSGAEDPVAPLFDIVAAMITRRDSLRCGIIFSIPARELGVLNEQRGDFVARLDAQRLGLDLRNIYSTDFASQLWDSLAEQFDFKSERDAVLQLPTLLAIGEIAARQDLASGPRTVVAALQRAVTRYLDEARHPYTPIDLIDDFRAGNIPFDQIGRIAGVVNERLSSRIVAGQPERERLIRLIAAFPTEGCPRALIDECGLGKAADDVAQAGQGELVIFVGSPTDPGMTLQGLERVPVDMEWLPSTLREFSRGYVDTADLTLRRALSSFERLLVERLFPPPQWKVLERSDRSLTKDHSMLLEGAFPSMAKTYPQRRVYVRILRDIDQADGKTPVARIRPDADLSIDFILSRYQDLLPERRRSEPGSVSNIDAARVRIELNLGHRSSGSSRPDLHKQLQPVVNPYNVNPLLLLALDEFLEEKRRNHQMPQQEDELIRHTFQSSLVDECLSELFNPELHGPSNTAGERLLETLVADSCRHLLPDYCTLMVNQQWGQAVEKEYAGAVGELRSQFQREGEEPVEASKTEIANMFRRSNPAFDSFVSSFPTLIKVVREFRGNNPGAVLFTMHPLELVIRDEIKGSGRKVRVTIPGRGVESMPILDEDTIYKLASRLGYRSREVDAVLKLVEARGVVHRDVTRGVFLMPRKRVEISELRAALAEFTQNLTTLHSFFGGQALNRLVEENAKLETLMAGLKGDEQRMDRAQRAVQSYLDQLTAIQEEKQQGLQNELESIALEGIDRAALEILQTPVRHDFFGLHVDTLRRQLLDESQRFTRQQMSMDSQKSELLEDFRDDLSASELVGLAKRVRKLAERERELTKTRKALDDRRPTFLYIQMVLDTSLTVHKELADAGGIAEEAEARFDQLMHDITEALAERGRDALDQVRRWERELGEIRQQIREIQEAGERAFKAWCDDLTSTLKAHVDVAPEDLPSQPTYNPLAPDEARATFSLVIDQVLAETLDSLREEWQTAAASLSALHHSGDLDRVDGEEKLVAERRLAECGDLLTELGDALRELVDMFPPDGVASHGDIYEKFCPDLGRAQARLARMAELHGQVEKVIGPVRLTSAEYALMHTLGEIDDGSGIDLGALLTEMELALEQLLDLIGSLYKKRALTVTLTTTARATVKEATRQEIGV